MESLKIAVKITPKANKSEIVGWKEGELVIRIAAIPEKGEANRELIRFLAKALSITQNQIIIINGETSRHKKLLIENVIEQDLQERIRTETQKGKAR